MQTKLEDHPILIVDDEQPNLELMQRFLRRKYKNLTCAQDPSHALWIIESQGVDLIICDQKMPKLEGTEVLETAARIQPKAMRILVTGYGDVETLTHAINAAQVFQVLTKPIDFKMLELAVQRALEAHESAAREQAMFDAFVYASVTAMEQRDPSTAGHSFRVAVLTTGLASAVDKVSDGPLSSVKFSRDDVEQIKYASLLHDYGKIAVPEELLVKARKLPVVRRQIIDARIGDGMRSGSIGPEKGANLHAILALLDDPATNPLEHRLELDALAAANVLDGDDRGFLEIAEGSLSNDERRIVEGHVLGTIEFLKKIPWPRRFARVAEIAGAHHEKLTGRGYPYGLTEIPIESRMMTICDIYDALCASDRPYRIAASPERALDILADMVKAGEVDPVIFDVFAEQKIWRLQNRGAKNPLR
jgi:response regulator RpfG family c-di-GMP phosphodiesterase